MSFLVVAGITVACARDTASKRLVRIGSSSRSFDGTLRSQTRAQKREWTVSTTPTVEATAVTLEAAVDLGEQVTCSGDLLGGSVTCEVSIDDSKYVGTGSTTRRVMTLVIREV